MTYKQDHAAEKQKLADAVDDFSLQMRTKLWRKADEGWAGWDNTNLREVLAGRLVDHIARANRGGTLQWVDVANLAMFLHYIDLSKGPKK